MSLRTRESPIDRDFPTDECVSITVICARSAVAVAVASLRPAVTHSPQSTAPNRCSRPLVHPVMFASVTAVPQRSARQIYDLCGMGRRMRALPAIPHLVDAPARCEICNHCSLPMHSQLLEIRPAAQRPTDALTARATVRHTVSARQVIPIDFATSTLLNVIAQVYWVRSYERRTTVPLSVQYTAACVWRAFAHSCACSIEYTSCG
jgi:hypothetical protein